ncbi:MJ0042-type zinc finger domain-containing protein [Sphingomonas humi]|uniref:DUF3426 domain-containing protein n=1 Tax=Sphingomonas humi TaxID=335630 RepID=A0ABP7RKP2_9SPHN
MILTCPSCGTRYVVKDGAIPPAGRTVRCAQCKHSWHQDPDDTAEGGVDQPVADPGEQGAEDFAVPHADGEAGSYTGEVGDTAYPAASPDADGIDDPLPSAEASPSAAMLAEQETASTMPEEAATASDPYPEDAVPVEPETPQDTQFSDNPPIENDAPRASHPMRAARVETEDLYSPFAGSDEEPAPRNRLPMIIGALLLVIAVVAAAVYFLAPTELKGRLGLAQGDASNRLTVQVQQHGRTQLASGNQLFEVSGIVRNETDETLPVPPLNAQLRSLEQQVVYRWTIPISPPQLAPGASASFNSANLDVPSKAACLEVFFGQQRSAPRCRDEQTVGA